MFVTIDANLRGAGMRISGQPVTQILSSRIENYTGAASQSFNDRSLTYWNSDGFAANSRLLAAKTKTVVGRFVSGLFSYTPGTGLSDVENINAVTTPFNNSPLVGKLRLVNNNVLSSKINIWLVRSGVTENNYSNNPSGTNGSLLPIESAALFAELTSGIVDLARYDVIDRILQGRDSGAGVREYNNITMRTGDAIIVESELDGVVAHWEAFDPSSFQGARQSPSNSSFIVSSVQHSWGSAAVTPLYLGRTIAW